MLRVQNSEEASYLATLCSQARRLVLLQIIFHMRLHPISCNLRGIRKELSFEIAPCILSSKSGATSVGLGTALELVEVLHGEMKGRAAYCEEVFDATSKGSQPKVRKSDRKPRCGKEGRGKIGEYKRKAGKGVWKEGAHILRVKTSANMMMTPSPCTLVRRSNFLPWEKSSLIFPSNVSNSLAHPCCCSVLLSTGIW